ncbi:Protein LOW PSII ACCUMULATION 1-like [Dillenia turbinata]|uniref:Protein LOW PSII ACCUMULATION 1-like n=1 Tax=Dillenia turbinata TaxID=194707 RepID=A0AAN8W0J4_9MAGN
MATLLSPTHTSYILYSPTTTCFCVSKVKHNPGFSFQISPPEKPFFSCCINHAGLHRVTSPASIACSAANKSSPSSEVSVHEILVRKMMFFPCLYMLSSTAKIRSEVLSPFRSVRMFFYLAFVASGALGGLIATTQLIGALSNPSRSAEIPDIVKGLGIDIAAVAFFAFLYSQENKAKSAQLVKLSREEGLSNLKLRIDEKRIIPVSSLRGIARLVILAGPASFINESFRLSEPFTQSLLDRGVLVVPFATDGYSPSFEFEENEEMAVKRKRLWQLSPVYTTEWSKWLDEQKKLASVPPDSPVYGLRNYTCFPLQDNFMSLLVLIQSWHFSLNCKKIVPSVCLYLSLRMDGRVRGSGVGYPPWNAFSVQLPPVKGMWSGLLDGMDGRVL